LQILTDRTKYGKLPHDGRNRVDLIKTTITRQKHHTLSSLPFHNQDMNPFIWTTYTPNRLSLVYVKMIKVSSSE
jgi:hypothetical protein